jgi:hypothetical protein
MPQFVGLVDSGHFGFGQPFLGFFFARDDFTASFQSVVILNRFGAGPLRLFSSFIAVVIPL